MVCGYVHETPDEELPADFRCPLCGFGPEKFERID
jgi:rubredoxin